MNVRIKGEADAAANRGCGVSCAPSDFPWEAMRRLWQRLLHAGKRSPKRLRLAESLPLGERRFVAVVEYGSSRFLLGGTSTSLVLLARLNDGFAGPAAPAEDPRKQNPESEDGVEERPR